MLCKKACRIRPDYHDKRLENPFFQRRRAGKSPVWKKWAWRAALIVFVFLVWFLLASPWLKIKRIEVLGLTRLPNAEIENIVWERTQDRRWLIFRASNILLFRSDEARAQIEARHNFAAVSVKKKLFNRIVVKIGERPYDFIFQQGSDYRYASADGYIINEIAVSEEDKGRYFILENKNPQLADMIGDKGKLQLSADLLSFVLELNRILSVQPELKPERFIIDQEANTVKVKLVEGPTALFNSKAEASGQVDYLLAVKRDRLKESFSQTNYIDLRYGEKIFIN